MTNAEATALVTTLPEDAKPVRGNIDPALAAAIFLTASEDERGATDGVVYESADSDEYKAAVKRFRLHLNTRLDLETQRAKVVQNAVDDGVMFSVQIATRTKRASK